MIGPHPADAGPHPADAGPQPCPEGPAGWEDLPEPVVLLDTAGRIRAANAAWRRWWGGGAPVDLAELEERIVEGALPPPDTGAASARLHLRLPGGRVVPVRLHRVPLPAGALFCAVDLSAELVAREDALRRARAETFLDLLGGGGAGVSPLRALSWLAGLGDAALAACPEWMRPGLARARRAAAHLVAATSGLHRPGGDHLAEAPLQLLLVGGDATAAGRFQERLAGAGLPARVRAVTDPEEAMRRMEAGMEVDAVLLAPELPREQGHAFLLEAGRRYREVPVFDLAGGRLASLVPALLRQAGERRRRSRLAAAWSWLEELALRDPLTGVLNRRAFERAAAAELARSRRYGLPLTLAILDLDRFKLVNDTLGHLEGDRLLQAVGATLSSSARESDLVARLGGDEFVLLMPHTAAAAGRLVAARVAGRLDELLRRLAPGISPPPGASFGVAATSGGPGGPDLATLLRRADADLYRVKASHRGGESPEPAR